MNLTVLDSLIDQGFRRILIWRGCGQHDLSSVIERFNEQHSERAIAIQPDAPYHQIWCQIGNPDVPGGHSDSFITSLALHLRPESVRKDLIQNPNNDPVNWDDPNLDFSDYSLSGVIGDPTYSSAELGAKLWVAVVNRVAEILRDSIG